jgi:hypothetical protein
MAAHCDLYSLAASLTTHMARSITYANLALIFGEFGIGYMAWSTGGNDSANAWLDLMTNWSCTTSWGNTVWYRQYGISNTAQRTPIY